MEGVPLKRFIHNALSTVYVLRARFGWKSRNKLVLSC